MARAHNVVVDRGNGDERASICQLFYHGIGSFSTFDNLLFIREPSNPFDINSVLVILATKNREVLGHLERSVAAGIAELMDNYKFKVKVVTCAFHSCSEQY